MKALFTLICGLALTASAVGGNVLCKGIAPENNVRIPVDAKRSGGLTEEQFNTVLDRLYAAYSPEYTKKGATFKIERKWEDATANAYAQQFGTVWQISMFGGLARHDLMTADGFTLVACHETGHHLGGAPKGVEIFWPSKMSNEGQADYFATLKCARHVWESENNDQVVASMNVDAMAKSECEAEYKDHKDQMICMRASMAGKVLAAVLADLGTEGVTPEFNTPDLAVVSRTDNAHPAAQCRMDTYFNGARCSQAWANGVSDTDYKQGTCDMQAYNTGSRPHCWFKAK